MKFAICNEIFAGWTLERTMDFVAKTGYDGLEIAPFTLADSVSNISGAQRRRIKSLAQERGLTITGLHWLLVKPEGLHITHFDRGIRRQTVDYLCRLTEFCSDIGGSVMVFGCPNQRNILDEVTREQAWQYAVDSFAACAETLSAHNVTLCLEALPKSSTNLLNTNGEVRQMVDDIGHPNIQMMLDVKSMCAEAIPLPENIRSCAGRFYHVHANDANLKGPGFGDVDFVPIFATLGEVGFDGFVSVEAFDFTPDPETIATKSLEYMKQCLSD